jgi:spoIIIJ-associated protein
MASLEIEGKSIDEAIEAACSQLNVPKEKLEIEILTTGSTGIFGIVGSKKARIRATVKEEPVALIPEPEIQALPEPEVQALPEPETVRASLSDDELIEEAKTLTQDILTLMGLEATISVQKEKETLQIRIEGEKSGLLIGRRGQTLDALQYLVTRILNRKGLDKIKVDMDSGDYRTRRTQYLEELALKMAEKSKQTGKPVVISPLNAHDRRIIHLTLEKEKNLKTVSRGEGQLKKMVISVVKKDRPTTPPDESET